MIPVEVPRPDLADALLARAKQGPPLLLTGPPGSGKTTLLGALGAALARDGWIVVCLDLMGAASSPERFVAAALDAMPAAAFGRHLSRATEIRRLADAGRAHEAAAVRGLLDLWAGLGDASGRSVALLLDEATEIRSLAYFAGLRDVAEALGAALASRGHGTILATSFPSLARKHWSFDAIEARPLGAADLAPVLAREGVRSDAAALARASFGWPRYVRILLERLAAGDGLAEAWAAEMAPGERLDLACRSTYESLLLRSRGYGMSKAVLATVAAEEGLNLTALVERLGRTPGAVRDYLQWLVGVDALRMHGKRYHYVDGLLRHWVRLYARGTPAAEAERLELAREALAAPASEAAAVEGHTPARPVDLMEID